LLGTEQPFTFARKKFSVAADDRNQEMIIITFTHKQTNCVTPKDLLHYIHITFVLTSRAGVFYSDRYRKSKESEPMKIRQTNDSELPSTRIMRNVHRKEREREREREREKNNSALLQ